MSQVFVEISMSLDGYIAGPNDGPENGLGDGGEQLHEWVTKLASWREPHGLEGGETGTDADLLEESFKRAGAVILGKRMFENAQGWGDNPPFHMPVFVLTHTAREQLTKGDTPFTFVTEGVESALEQAREAADDKDVSIGGGANTIQQCLAAGFVDDIQIHVTPTLLGGGIRLFDELDPTKVTLEKARVIDSPDVTHLQYRVTN